MEREGLTGKVIWPFDPEYDRARQEYNRDINAYPVAIVYCFNNQDVTNAIRWSHRNWVGLRIRSGGHNYNGYSTGNGKLVIDTTRMNDIKIDPDAEVVKVQAGTRLSKLYADLYQYGYAFPGGTCPTVAISGLVLGGGIGLSTRYLGLTCDSLVGAEMVNAQGHLVTANRECHPDLFWALRGAGGGNYGVVTSFSFALKKKIDKITLIQLKWDPNKPARLRFLSVWQEWLGDLDPRMSAFGRVYQQGVFFFAFFYGLPGEAAEILAPILSISSLTLKSIEYVDFIEAVNTIGAIYPPSDQFVDTGRFVYRHLNQNELENLVKRLDQAPSAQGSLIKVYSLGGAVSAVNPDQTAFYYRTARYIMDISSSWKEDEEAFINKAWVAKGFAYMKKLTCGSYVNFPYRKLYVNFPYRKLKDYLMAYYGEHVKLLRNIKDRYDPCNVFSFPQSIEPLGT